MTAHEGSLGDAQVAPRLLTLAEAADAVGCSTWTLRRRIAAGALVATKVDRHVRIRVDDLRAYLDGRRDLGRQLYGVRSRPR